jgi:hypothetical protein
MNGSEVTLAQALAINGTSKTKSNSPDDRLKSPREGPLKWDGVNKRWQNNET